MPEDPDKPSGSQRPLSDRETVASKFADGKLIDDAQDPEAKRHGRDLSHENYAPQGGIDNLEGDSLLERLRPYLIIGVLMAIFIGVIAYILPRTEVFDTPESVSNSDEADDSSLVSRPTASRASSELNPAAAIVEDNTVTIGGYERLKRLSSLTARGVVIKDGEEIPFSLYARRPTFYRLVYQVSPDDEYVVGFDGEHMWEEYKRQGSTISTSPLPDSEQKRMRQVVDFDLPPQKYVLLGEYMVDRQTPVMDVSLSTRDFIDKEMFEVLRFEEEGRPDTLTYIGASNNLVYQTITETDGVKYKVVYDDYRKVDGVYVPFRREQYVDGELSAEIKIKSVEFNPGVLLRMFSPPNASNNAGG